MSPYLFSLLIVSLGIGTTLTFASSNWLLAWIGLEINTLAILPLMTQNPHPRATEAATKYFLVQEAAAATILFSAENNAWFTGSWSIMENSSPTAAQICFLALAFKIGLAPLHGWLPETLQGLNFPTGMILATWQKLAPFALLIQMAPHVPPLALLLGISSTLVGAWGGLNQNQLRKILAYSSIAHLGWMTLILQFAPTLTLLTLLLYIMMTLSLFFLFIMNKSKTINALAISWNKTPILTTLAPLLLLSLAGLPPLTGFTPKWLILHELTKQDLPILATMMALSALLSAYFYLRLAYTMTMTTPPGHSTSKPSWRRNTLPPNLPLAITISITTLILPLTPALTALISM